MDKVTNRLDDYTKRSKHLKSLTDEQLKTYFWELAEQVTNPLIELAKTHTSPSIERSILLRMGFSSIEAKGIVQKVIDHDLMSKGAGHVVYKLSIIRKIDIRDAGLLLLNDKGWDEVINSFEVDNDQST